MKFRPQLLSLEQRWVPSANPGDPPPDDPGDPGQTGDENPGENDIYVGFDPENPDDPNSGGTPDDPFGGGPPPDGPGDPDDPSDPFGG